MPLTAPPLVVGNWFQQAITSKTTLVCLAIIVATAIVMFFVLRATVRLGRHARLTDPQTDTTRGEQGTTSIEFALVLPILLFLGLTLVQTMMLMVGNMYVHYAAFQAARHAIVEIPADYEMRGGLGENLYTNAQGSLKYDRILRAAAYALVPVAGETASGGGRADDYVAGVRAYFGAYGQQEPAWVEKMLAGKVRYAMDNTAIEVLETRIVDEDDVSFDSLPQEPYRFGAKDPVTVRIEHKLSLGVPIASKFFADGDNGSEGTGRFTTVVAQFTLTNEGVPTRLPDLPDIPRVDRDTPVLPDDFNSPNPLQLIP